MLEGFLLLCHAHLEDLHHGLGMVDLDAVDLVSSLQVNNVDEPNNGRENRTALLLCKVGQGQDDDGRPPSNYSLLCLRLHLSPPLVSAGASLMP